MAWASRSKRSLNGLRLALMATSRLRRVSRAFQTSPMPPAPRAERISYGPSRIPGDRAMETAHDYRVTVFAEGPRDSTIRRGGPRWAGYAGLDAPDQSW